MVSTLTWRLRLVLGISSPGRNGGTVSTSKLWLRFASAAVLRLLTGDEEVDRRVRERKDYTEGVEQGEVKLLSKITHVLGKRHASDEQSLHSAHVSVMVVGVVQMSESPGLDDQLAT